MEHAGITWGFNCIVVIASLPVWLMCWSLLCCTRRNWFKDNEQMGLFFDRAPSCLWFLLTFSTSTDQYIKLRQLLAPNSENIYSPNVSFCSNISYLWIVSAWLTVHVFKLEVLTSQPKLYGRVKNRDSICGPVPWTWSIKIWTRSMDPLNLLPHINKDYSSVLITHHKDHIESLSTFFTWKPNAKFKKKKQAKYPLIQFQLFIF